MTTDNDAQAAALAEALAPSIAATVQAQVDEQLKALNKTMSDRLDGIAVKNAQLLGKLHTEKSSRTSLEDQLAKLNEHLQQSGEPVDIEITRTDARNVKKYRAAKAAAEKADVQLVVVRDPED
jgi:trehalose-6-phosphatase